MGLKSKNLSLGFNEYIDSLQFQFYTDEKEDKL